MKRIQTWLVIAILGGLAFWIFQRVFPSQEGAIRRELSGLARAASFKPNEAPLFKVANIGKLRSYFTPDVAVRVNLEQGGSHMFEGRDDLMEAVALVRGKLPGLELEFLDTQVDVSPDRNSATVLLTLRYRLGDDKEQGLQELKIALKKIERAWKVSRVENVNALTR